MYRHGLFILSLMAACAPCWSARNTIEYDPGSMSFPISVSQAEDAARAWAGDPTLQFTLQGVTADWFVDSSPREYSLRTASGTQSFSVDCSTGEITSWADEPLQEQYRQMRDSPNPPASLTAEQQTQIARGFLETKYPGFGQLVPRPLEPTRFMRQYESGAWDPGNSCQVFMNVYDGTIWGYMGFHTGLAISTDPLVDRLAAESAALSAAAALPDVQSAFLLTDGVLGIDRTDATGLQRLAWVVTVVVSPDTGYTLQTFEQESQEAVGPTGEVLDISVDGHTGEVYLIGPGGYAGSGPRPPRPTSSYSRARQISPSKGATSPVRGNLSVDGGVIETSFPPLVMDDVPWLYVRHVSALRGGTTVWHNGRITLSMGTMSVDLHPGSRNARINGRQVVLPMPVRVLWQRAYLPLQSLRAVGLEASWDAKSMTLLVGPARNGRAARPSRPSHSVNHS